MKGALLLLLLALPLVQAPPLCGQSPPPAPTGLRIGTPAIPSLIPIPVTTGTNNPFGLPFLSASAWWQAPDTNAWIAQISPDGSSWTQGSEVVFILPRAARAARLPCPSCWHFTEVPSNFFVRIKKIN